MLVTIIVPFYNREKYLAKCIESLINQTYKNIEIVLVDDGSTDDSKEICYSFQKKDDRIKYIYKNHSGVSASRNKGIEMSSGEYLTFVDSDDTIAPNYVETLVNNQEDNTLVKVNENQDIVINKNEHLRKLLTGEQYGTSCMYLLNKDLIGELRFDEKTSHMEDTLFIVKYTKRVDKVKLISKKLYIQNNTENSLTTSSTNIAKIIEDYYYSIVNIKSEVEFIKIEDSDEIAYYRLLTILVYELKKKIEKNEINNIVNSTVINDILNQNIKMKHKISINFRHILKTFKFRKISFLIKILMLKKA